MVTVDHQLHVAVHDLLLALDLIVLLIVEADHLFVTKNLMPNEHVELTLLKLLDKMLNQSMMMADR